MELSEFLYAYLECGNTLLEGKFTQDPAQAVKMLANFAPNELPGTVRTPDQVPSPADPQKPTASEAIKAAVDAAGMTAYAYKTGEKDMVAYRGATFNPPTGQDATIFTKAEWDATINYYDQRKDIIDQEGQGGTPEDEMSPEEQAEQRKAAQIAQADAFAENGKQNLADAGFKGNVATATRSLFRQIFGHGGDNPIRKAARQRAGEEIDEQEEDVLRYQDALIINSLISRVAQIAKEVRNGGENLTESDRKFLRECLRLRGHGKSRGIYIVPSDSAGDACGGDLASVGMPFEEGGKRYGVKIGNQRSAIFEASEWLHKQSLREGNPLYDEGKPAIFWGGTEASRMNSFRAMDGVMNEHGPRLAQAWIECGRTLPCSAMNQHIEGMLAAEQFNLNLLIFGAEQRNMGKIPDETQYTDINGDGNELILDDIEAVQGDVDGPKALAWYVGSLLNSWDAIVSDPMFDGCNFDVVGRGPTGQQQDGGAVNQDVQVSCGKLAKKLVVNKKNQVESGTGIFGDDADKNRAHYTGEPSTGINVKTSNEGTDVQYGKRGCAVIDAVETDAEGQITGFTESTERARNRHANYLYGVAKQNGEELTEQDKADADDYKMKEINAVNDVMKSVVAGGLSTGTVNTVMDGILRKMGYDEGEQFAGLKNMITDYKNAPNPSPERQKLEKKLRVTLTNAYRNKNQNAPGFRLNMAIEYCQTGMATQNQGFVITKPEGGNTYVGSESDGIGTAGANIMGYGREGGPAPITSITGTGVNFEGGISLRRRLKEGVMVQESLESTDSILPRMRKLSGAKAANTGDSVVGNSSMKAEDFVRQLQELIQRIDKVSTV